MADIQTRTYLKHMTRLADLLGSNPQCCLTLAIELASRQLIALDTLGVVPRNSGKERAFAVLDAAHSKFKGDPDAFRKFVDALKQEDILSSVADEMQREVDCRGSEGNVTSEPAAASGRALVSPSLEGGGKCSVYKKREL